MADDPPAVNHNAQEHRFEVKIEGELAVLEYEQNGDSVTLTHMVVPEGHQGEGIGSHLAKAALEYAREEGQQVIPQCPFVATYLREHPEYLELVVPEYRERPAA